MGQCGAHGAALYFHVPGMRSPHVWHTDAGGAGNRQSFNHSIHFVIGIYPHVSLLTVPLIRTKIGRLRQGIYVGGVMMDDVIAVGREVDRAVAEWMGDDLRVLDKHDWKLDEKGKIDMWAMDADPLPHNGPACTRCGYSFCYECHGDAGYKAQPCEITFPYYSTSIDAAVKAWRELAKRGFALALSFTEDGKCNCQLADGSSIVCGTLAEVICRIVLVRG